MTAITPHKIGFLASISLINSTITGLLSYNRHRSLIITPPRCWDMVDQQWMDPANNHSTPMY